ncbi:MAG TPA: 50S ribosomal protein L25/general stress protein Ctc [Bacillota bacterium]|nr:50S ribosomal protein L25/general stress protein Ctc [Bacillota bacterium]
MAVKLKALKRDDLRQSATNDIRNRGDIPAVVYGGDKDSRTISINSLELIKTVRDNGRNAIITLDIDGGDTVEVMLHEYQMHPLKDEVIHADFYTIDLSEEMDVEVPLRLEGEAQGDRDGGILQQPLYELQVRAKPNEIPEEIVVNIDALEIGDNISISDLPASDTYEFLEEEDTVLAVILPPEEEEEEAADVDLSVEPEVVGADDSEEEEEEE